MATNGGSGEFPQDEGYFRASAEANEVFQRLREVVDRSVADGAEHLDLLEVTRDLGLEIDEHILRELKLPLRIPALKFVDWEFWFPWRPLWCRWWEYRYPYYHCCPYWWSRCHWYL